MTDAATSLKLVEYGMPKEEIAMLSPILVTLGMLIPVAVGRITAGARPMKVFLWGYPLRILVTIVYLRVLPLSRWVCSVFAGTGWLITVGPRVPQAYLVFGAMGLQEMDFCRHDVNLPIADERVFHTTD